MDTMEQIEKLIVILWCWCFVRALVRSDEGPFCPTSCSCSFFEAATEGFCRGCPTGSTPSTARKVRCESVGLSGVPADVPSEVNWLDLSRNNITRLRSRSLSRTRNLIHLKLSQNNVHAIDDDVFQGLGNLKVIDLDLNNLTGLGQATFAGAESLIHLDLSGNRIENADGVFAGLKDLSRLDLRNNRLSQLTQNTFRGLASLRYLLLTSNRINHIDRRTFRPLEKLVYVVLKGNPIGDQPLRFHFHSNSLTYLDVSECGLSEVPKGLPGSARYLQLRRNNLTVLARNSFVECPFLTILVLDENQISSIEDRTFEHLAQLQQLWLNNNRLTELPRPLPPSAERLLVDLNRVEEIRADSFPVRSQMHTLSLMGNNVTGVAPEAFDPLEKARTLDLSNNRIRRIRGGTFDRLRQLRILQLSGNPLQDLDPECFRGLASLATLSLSYVPSPSPRVADTVFEDLVQLSRLDLDSSPGLVGAVVRSDGLLASLGRVQELSMRGSDLVRLRPEVLVRFLGNLTTLRMSSARWRCDRSLVWLRDWMASAPLRLDDGDDNRCGSPRILHGRSLLSLRTEEFASEIVELLPTVDNHYDYHNPTPTTTPTPTNPTPLPVSAVTSSRRLPAGYGAKDLEPGEIDIDSIYDYDKNSRLLHPIAGSQNKSNVWNGSDSFDFRFYDPLVKSSESKTTTHHGNDRGRSTVSYSRSTIAIVIATVSATLVIVIVILGVIVHLMSDRRSRRTRPPGPERVAGEKLVIPYKHKNGGILYYMPETGKSKSSSASSDAPDLIRKTDSGEAMTLIPGRDFKHEGPMRVYKWEDF